MLGLKLFLRAVTSISDDLGGALRVSLLPYLATVAAGLWLAHAHPEVATFAAGGRTVPQALPPDVAAAVLGILLLNFFVFSWVAVAWHRRILLGEASVGWRPRFDGGLVLGYAGRTILLGIAVVLLALAAGTVVAVFILPVVGAVAAPLVSAVALFVGMILLYRFGVVLPAGAVGRSMGFGEALRMTAGHSRTAVVLALLTVVLAVLLDLPSALDAETARATEDGEAGMDFVTAVYQAVTGWIGLMLGIGTLTMLYDHAVEGRPRD